MVGISGSNDNTVTTPTTPSTPTIPSNQQTPIAPVLDSSLDTPEDLDARWTRWKCMVCNYTYEGREALKKCPRCGNEDPDKFNDAD